MSMKKILKQGGIVNRVMWCIYDLVILNVLWVVCSIPVITIGATTTSLFYVSGKIVRGEDVSVAKDFFKSFKLNFKQSTIVWLILAACYAVVLSNIYFFSGYDVSWASTITIIQFPILAVLILTTIFIFPILSRFNSTVKDLFRNSFILGVRHFVSCLICVGIVVAGAFLVKLIPAFMLIILASVIALAIYAVLNRTLREYEPKQVAFN